MTLERALFGVGYALSLPGTLALLRIAWRRWVWAFLALEAGTACVAAAWAVRGDALAAWFNAGCGVGFAATWVAVGRLRRARGLRDDSA